jgi:predicted HNH restriction endonuclease
MYASHKGEGNPMFRHGNRTGKDNHKARMSVKALLGGVCLICQWPHHAEVHHIVAKAKGGSDEIENLIILCPNHHWLADRGELAPEYLEGLALWRRRTPNS